MKYMYSMNQRFLRIQFLLCGLTGGFLLPSVHAQEKDFRNFENGKSIYQNGYIDQPYVVVLPDESWFCVFTTGAQHEGEGGQHVVASVSKDRGATWSDPVDIEPSTGPAASWVMPYLTDYGRIYVFYDFNGDEVSTLNGREIRNDMLGWYCFKYSDDKGKTWSKRYRLPVRQTKADLLNDWQGKVQIMWGIGKPVNVGKGMMFAFTKLGKYMLDNGEGWFFRCDNINKEKDPERLQWKMLPEGDGGLRRPAFGSVQEEQNLVELNNGDLYCMYRSTMGYAVNAYSRDGGKTWTLPEIAQYADGRSIKNPRACPRIWKCKNGKYLFWYHNHSGDTYADRNPAWIAGGIEKDRKIYWSQPEVLIYGKDRTRESGRFSYPDLIEQDGRYWITTTNKNEARVIEVDKTLLEGLWTQADQVGGLQQGLVLSLDEELKESDAFASIELAKIHREKTGRSILFNTVDDHGGVSFNMTLDFKDLSPGQTLLYMKDESGSGITVETFGYRQIKVDLSNGEKSYTWTSDAGWLDIIRSHQVSIIIDNGPNMISFVVDGKLCDGGLSRQYGWTRFDPYMGVIRVARNLNINTAIVKKMRLYDRPIRVSEAISMHRADNVKADLLN
jgi:hypothetical protein